MRIVFRYLNQVYHIVFRFVNRFSILFCYNFCMNTFGDKIKSFRNAHNLTQKALAEKLSITVSSLSHWECGYQEPSFDLLTKLADFFECSADYLLGREDDFGNITVQSTQTQLLSNEQALLDNFRKLPEDLQYRASAYMENLVKLGVSEKQSNFTHKNYSYKKNFS